MGAAFPVCGVYTVSVVLAMCVAPPTVAMHVQPHLMTSPLHNTSSPGLNQHILTCHMHEQLTHFCIMLCIPLYRNETKCRNSTYLLLTLETSKVLVGTVGAPQCKAVTTSTNIIFPLKFDAVPATALSPAHSAHLASGQQVIAPLRVLYPHLQAFPIQGT